MWVSEQRLVVIASVCQGFDKLSLTARAVCHAQLVEAFSPTKQLCNHERIIKLLRPNIPLRKTLLPLASSKWAGYICETNLHHAKINHEDVDVARRFCKRRQ